MAGYDFIKLFDKAPPEVRRAAVTRTVKKGATILHLEQQNSSLYGVLEGEAEVYFENANFLSTTICTYRKGEFFGEMELFDDNRTSLAVVAKKDCTLVVLHKDYVFLWMQKDFPFTRAICCNLVEHFTANNQGVAALKPLPLKDRYLYCLYRSDRFSELQALTKTELCARLGTDIRCVNRIVRQCSEEGFAAFKNRHFVILDRNKLQKHLQLKNLS